MTTSNAVVNVAGLSKGFGGRTVITGVSLCALPGDVVGLVGANGGGKTTALRMIGGVLPPDAGTGTVLGEDVRRAGRAVRSRVGYMSQRLALYPDLSVRENLRFRADAYGIAAPRDRIDGVTAQYGLGEVLDQRVETLSGGWSRRAQFAATVLHAPALLLLDEPTAGLDPATRRDLWRWIGELAGQGTTVLLATHDLAEAERLRTIILIDRGSASAVMDPGELMAIHGAATLEDAVIRHARGIEQ